MASKENRVLLPLSLNSSSSSNATPKCDAAHLSPVTDLALNLCGLTTGQTGTPRRKFSWSGRTPVTTFYPSIGSSDSPAVDSPTFQERLLRQVSFENNCTPSSVGLHRIHTLPSRALQPRDKENVPANHLPIPLPAVDFDSEDSGCHLAQETTSTSVLTDLEVNVSHKLKVVESSIKERTDSGLQSFTSSSDESPKRKFSFNVDDDDGFSDVFNMDDGDKDMQFLPSCMSDLLTAPIVQEHAQESKADYCHRSTESRRVPIRRCLSLMLDTERILPGCCSGCISSPCHDHSRKPNCSRCCDPNNNITQDESRKRLCNDENESSLKMAFKRPEPPSEAHVFECKRRKSVTFVTRFSSDSQVTLSAKKQPLLQRSYSESEATIKQALQRSVQHPDLIGDFSKPYSLPLENGRHQDLKAISIQTLADLMNGSYDAIVHSFTVVDCRYPYEYEGGHIQGAKNIYTKEGIVEEFLSSSAISSNASASHVVVFHCEFSSERGPSLCRFLRNKDRESNKDTYPKLHHPELYMLEGGYKAFYQEYKEFCVPQLYKPMLHKDHENDLRKFRAKSKSWNGDSKSRVAVRPGLKL